MRVSADLRDALKAAEVAGGRVYRDERPQGAALPAVVLQVISAPIEPLMKGEQPLGETRIQANCLADSRGSADLLRAEVLAARPLRAVVGETSFRRIMADGGREDSDRGQDGKTIFRATIDLIVWARPAS